MEVGKNGAILRQFRTLFSVGTLRDLTDGQLLERFAMGRGDSAELAFAALVERHGPMVLRVCRGVLADPHDVQDAFQATFLVLVRKTRALWVRDSLGPWLHQVAFRTASCARSDAARRRKHERIAAEIAAARPEASAGNAGDWERAIHEEIDRLPDRYRVPVLLCDLQGRTREQAARHLGWPVGTVKSRLTRGRDQLRSRLIRRGLAPSLGLAGVLATDRAKAAVPATLVESTIRNALRFGAGRSLATAAISASVATLTEGGLRAMFLAKLKLIVLATLVVGGLAIIAGGSLLTFSGPATSTDEPTESKGGASAPKAKRPLEWPHLPGAITAAPDWAKGNAPFDVEAFFKAPPRDQNAEPLYLDALAEFDFMFGCYPPGEEEDRHVEAHRPRFIRRGNLLSTLQKDPKSVSNAEIDALLDEYREGFRKLDEAQSRPRCVFQAGLGYYSLLDHVQAARTVARVVTLKVRRELERGEIDSAIRDVERLIRLAHDLQPRGSLISQLFASVMIGIAHDDLILPILAVPGLKVEHCDRLLRVLDDSAAGSIDVYAEEIKAEYLNTRAILRELIGQQDQLRESLRHMGKELRPGESVVAAVVEGDTKEDIHPTDSPVRSLREVEDLDAKLARTTPDELARFVDKLDAYFGCRNSVESDQGVM